MYCARRPGGLERSAAGSLLAAPYWDLGTKEAVRAENGESQ